MIPLTAALRAAFEQGLRDDKCVFVQPKDGLAMIAVIEAAKALEAEASKRLRFRDAERYPELCAALTAVRTALAALDKEQK